MHRMMEMFVVDTGHWVHFNCNYSKLLLNVIYSTLSSTLQSNLFIKTLIYQTRFTSTLEWSAKSSILMSIVRKWFFVTMFNVTRNVTCWSNVIGKWSNVTKL